MVTIDKTNYCVLPADPTVRKQSQLQMAAFNVGLIGHVLTVIVSIIMSIYIILDNLIDELKHVLYFSKPGIIR